jgi:hypothetical protein
LRQDSALLSYDVKSYQRVSVGMSLRETARERLAFRTESAAHVRWNRATGARVEMLGARSAAPIVAGIKEAEDDINNDPDLNDMMAIPYYPGKDELWLFEMIGNNSDDEGRAMLVHPVAEGSEAYFTFATGDSVLMTLPDGKRITLREIRVIPREAKWNLVVGSFWFETERAFLVRAVMRFSALMDIWETAEAEDPDAKKDVPLLVRGLVSPMTAEITAVTIEYGLLNQRFWLPRTQGAEGYARVSFMRVPLKVEQSYRYESVNATDSLPAIPPPRFKTATELRDSLKAAGVDSTARREFMRAHYALRDSLAKADKAAQCATAGSYVEYHRQCRATPASSRRRANCRPRSTTRVRSSSARGNAVSSCRRSTSHCSRAGRRRLRRSRTGSSTRATTAWRGSAPVRSCPPRSARAIPPRCSRAVRWPMRSSMGSSRSPAATGG